MISYWIIPIFINFQLTVTWYFNILLSQCSNDLIYQYLYIKRHKLQYINTWLSRCIKIMHMPVRVSKCHGRTPFFLWNISYINISLLWFNRTKAFINHWYFNLLKYGHFNLSIIATLNGKLLWHFNSRLNQYQYIWNSKLYVLEVSKFRVFIY